MRPSEREPEPIKISDVLKLFGLVAAIAFVGWLALYPAPRAKADQVPISTPLSEGAWSDRIAATKTSEGDEAETEFRLPDGSRVDITTKTHAIEVEWCGPKHPRKYREAVGQALEYALLTGKKPGILLLLEDDSEQMKIDYVRCLMICRTHGIQLETWNVARLK